MSLQVDQFTCRSDNFVVLIHDPETGKTASIDAPEEGPILAALERNGWSLDEILTTHHHGDHVAGNAALKQRNGAKITGPAAEAGKIPGIDRQVSDGDTFTFGSESVEVIATPGHTLGEISYFFPASGLLFAGDTLFALGCGRVFEGTPEMMWDSLQKLMQLPPETAVYCGHEYTQTNAGFAVTVDPENDALAKRSAEISALRKAGKATLPTSIGLELQTNPFFRASDPGIRRTLGMENASDVEVFAELRTRRNNI
jgi:hydroxyacylglutathione hydrolase